MRADPVFGGFVYNKNNPTVRILDFSYILLSNNYYAVYKDNSVSFSFSI